MIVETEGDLPDPNRLVPSGCYYHRLGDILRSYREQAGCSVLELAAKAHLHPPIIRDIESGRRDPRLTELIRYARACQIKPEAVLLLGTYVW